MLIVCMSGKVTRPRVMQHLLPKGFRRVRGYGFLHGNTKRTLQCIQLMLKVRLSPPPVRQLTQKCCPHCNGKLHIIWLKRTRKATQIRPSSLTFKRTNTAMDCVRLGMGYAQANRCKNNQGGDRIKRIQKHGKTDDYLSQTRL
jgi:hypothetical protein